MAGMARTDSSAVHDMTDAMTDVTDEFIAEMSRSDVDTNIRSMAREIQRRRASDDAPKPRYRVHQNCLSCTCRDEHVVEDEHG
jgi:hypothetical protein